MVDSNSEDCLPKNAEMWTFISDRLVCILWSAADCEAATGEAISTRSSPKSWTLIAWTSSLWREARLSADRVPRLEL